MKKSFQIKKFQALAKKIIVLSSNDKGNLKGGFASVKLQSIKNVKANGYQCWCSGPSGTNGSSCDCEFNYN
ncbi:hypothetical protein EG349_16975 [Chryseobacterium shandongense]|uniref:Uncharacterized protein n=2 Tax=Chryseobacterium TaxID=59732 RepID=A0A3D9B8G5_9FLAO|nr:MULTISPECIES: hypothetical protein [Chryseobacterium]AZA88342.1 hypothetical protein EG349_16975 [Chryseobacterium shandongense]REC49951.1 hypothetical protein DRF68_09965 [Candidatus Chryseobacterium massiliae]